MPFSKHLRGLITFAHLYHMYLLTRRLPLFFYLICILCFGTALLQTNSAYAQLQGSGVTTMGNANDSAGKKTNTDTWSEEGADIYYTRYGSEKKLYPDTAIHTFHRRPFSQPWYRDLGNLGSPSRNLVFTPENPAGLSLGYHTFDVYRFKADSLPFYNTTKPYSAFTYQLGSKLEQTAQILHTQNIKPWWNFAFCYRKINSAGYYFAQRNNHDNAWVSSNYQSPNQQYTLNIALAYNKEQHDENGGILSDSFLNNASYSDRKSIPVAFQASDYSTTRSPVTTIQRDFTLLLNHSYTWGIRDTTYNEDSTQYSLKLTPRFRLSHRMELSSQRYQYKDLRPDSLRYDPFFQQTLLPTDSVYTQQDWTYFDNRFIINGLLGKSDNPFLFNAGIGNRIDQFKTSYATGVSTDNIVSNYLTGEIRKDAIKEKQWQINANAKLFITGSAAGNFELNGSIGKDLGKHLGTITIGARQQLNNAPYSYTLYRNAYWTRANDFNKESTTSLFATLDNEQYHLSAGVRNYLISNYLYFNEQQLPAQFGSAFSISQIWLRKLFRVGIVTLDNELMFQQSTNDAPVNIPQLLGRHQLAIETHIFKKKLQISTGIEVRYHTGYNPAGYSPFFNRFYYQSSSAISDQTEASVFFNFKIKRFRAYIMADQLQQPLNSNLLIAPGYTGQNLMIRFGFSWILVN